MITMLVLVASLSVNQDPPAWEGYNKGIVWEKSVDDAQKRAAREGKPVLLHQLVGDMNKEGC